MEDELDGQLTWSSVTQDDFDATGAGVEDAEGLSDLLSQSASAELMILFRENGERTKISVRTREGGPDATVLTGAFGGGGHARAAGATVDMPLDQSIKSVLDAARRMLTASGA
jgi:phosphoesterase RecJ-like protein